MLEFPVKDTSGAILAGGGSTRFNGRVKCLLTIDGQTILSKNTGILSSIFSEVFIITNKPEELSQHASLPIYPDIYVGKGPLGGIHAALTNTEKEAAFVFAGDMPFLQEVIIKEVIQAYWKSGADVFIPRLGEGIEPLHAIYGRQVLPAIEKQLRGDGNDNRIRSFFGRVNTVYYPFDLSLTKAFSNINTLEDYQNIMQKK